MGQDGAIILKASSFELERNDGQDVAGSFELTDEDMTTYQEIIELCSKPGVDKLVIVYRNYEFILVGVSLKGENINPEFIQLRKRNFKFSAKGVRLESAV